MFERWRAVKAVSGKEQCQEEIKEGNISGGGGVVKLMESAKDEGNKSVIAGGS